jgi:hypothetical protein
LTTKRACSSKTGGVGDWQAEFLVSCLDVVDDVTLAEGAFNAGPALWVGSREIAHFDQDTTLDVRLTKASIRSQRQALQNDQRVTLRKHQSDWIALSIEPDSDVKWARAMVVAAVEANRATAPSGPPPDGAELARRRRFH